MKKKNYILLFIIFAAFSTYGQVHDYKIDKKWHELKTENERISFLQIPNVVLAKKSTSDLIISCLNYPAFGHYTAFDSNQKGFEIVSNSFNGLSELLKRNDAGKELLKLYKQLTIKNFKQNKQGIDTRYQTIRFNFLELIMAQEVIINQLSYKDKKELIKTGVQKYRNKINSSDFNSASGITPTVLLIARTLTLADSKQFRKNKSVIEFTTTSKLLSINTVNDIISSSSLFLNK